ncbi:MAG: DUF456 domain-containing protein [Planctomycetes bacterium]|nr:DUF456 domain-containing protein [Planctomycetota bacterium]MCP4769846.1 DUF456 domain-containing protein [Planctomycetota bacterium]MCP4859686.1 DUF456 domain-containing protein [Planctomycetota bacterium]
MVYLLCTIGTLLFAGLGALLIPFGLPGTWMIAAVGLLGPTMGLGWVPFFVLVAAAGVGEILELLSATKVTKKAGAGKAGMWGCLIGGIVGAVVGTPLIPIPIIGTLLGSAFGALAGAIFFEMLFASKETHELMDIGVGAFLGVLLGKILKMTIGALQVVYWSLVVFGLL